MNNLEKFFLGDDIIHELSSEDLDVLTLDDNQEVSVYEISEMGKELSQIGNKLVQIQQPCVKKNCGYIIDRIRTQEPTASDFLDLKADDFYSRERNQKKTAKHELKQSDKKWFWNYSFFKEFIIWYLYYTKRLPIIDQNNQNSIQFSRKTKGLNFFEGLALCSFILIFLSGVYYIFMPQEPVPFRPSVQITKTQSDPQIINLKRDVTAVIAPHSEIKKITENQVFLKKGKIWLDVEKNGAGFQLDSTFGTVHVTGTSFGLSYLNNQQTVRVDVSEGTINFENETGIHSLNEGEYFLISGTIIERGIRENERFKAQWVLAHERKLELRAHPDFFAGWEFYPVNENGEKRIKDLGTLGIDAIVVRENEPDFEAEPGLHNLFGKSVLFDHSLHQSLELKNSELINECLMSDFTISCWVKQKELEGFQRLFSKLSHGFRWGFKDNALEFMGLGEYSKDTEIKHRNAFFHSTTMDEFSNTLNQWNHIALAVSHSEMEIRFIYNGKTIFKEALKQPLPIIQGKPQFIWRIGSGETNEETQDGFRSTFGGKIASFLIFKSYLSDEEISELAKIDLIKSSQDQSEQKLIGREVNNK